MSEINFTAHIRSQLIDYIKNVNDKNFNVGYERLLAFKCFHPDDNRSIEQKNSDFRNICDELGVAHTTKTKPKGHGPDYIKDHSTFVLTTSTFMKSKKIKLNISMMVAKSEQIIEKERQVIERCRNNLEEMGL